MKTGNYVPETPQEELMYLAGRQDALEAYLTAKREKDNYIEITAVAAILGMVMDERKPDAEKDGGDRGL